MTNARAGLLGLVALAILSALLILGVALLLRAAPPRHVPARWHAPSASPATGWVAVPARGR